MVTIDCTGKEIREINRELKRLAQSEPEIEIIHPDARHLIGVGLVHPAKVSIQGSVGYFCGGLCDGPSFEVSNNAGWCLAENMTAGQVVVRRNASMAAGSALMGATVVIHGNTGSRLGQVMKRGDIVVGGDAGHKTGFMMLGGRIVICGNAAAACGDFMIRGSIFVGGKVESLGEDALEAEVTAADKEELAALLDAQGIKAPAAWTKIVSAAKTQRYDKRQS